MQACSDDELRSITDDLRQRISEHTAAIEDIDEYMQAEREILDELYTYGKRPGEYGRRTTTIKGSKPAPERGAP